MRVPGHDGLAGNSAADRTTKDVILLQVSSLTVPHSDYKSLIRIQALRSWQLRWNSETENKMQSIESRVNVINMLRLPRRNEIIIHRLRIGHTYLTHGHLLRGETPSVLGLSSRFDCWACLASLCFLKNARDNFFCVTLTAMSEMFSKVASRSIIDFIEETGFYRKI